MNDEAVPSQEAPQAPESQSSAPPQSFDNSTATQQTASQASAPQQSVWEAFKALPEYAGRDDVSIARDLYTSRQGYMEAQQQLRQYQAMTAEYARNADQFRQWQQAQAQAQQPQQPAKPKWWDPPQVKDIWKQYIVRDPETGREVVAQDAPIEAQAAIRDYQAYTANFAKKFVTDPEGTLKPFIEDIVQQKAQELVQQSLGQYTAQNYVQGLEQQNADWLYDQSGQPTPEAQAIQAYIEQAAQSGIRDPQARWQYATGMLERDLLNMRYQQMQQMMAQQAAPPPQAPPQPEPTAQSNMQFLRERATRAPSRSGGATEPRAPRPKQTFEERLRAQLVKDGAL
jgi:hypothetical protein